MDTHQPYYWRRLTQEERAKILAERQRYTRPWHGPPHYVSDDGLYLISAACFEHVPIIGRSAERMANFEAELLKVIADYSEQIFAWVVLPNHYHALVLTSDVIGLLRAIGRLHGWTSFKWNGEDNKRGRQSWHRAAEAAMKGEGHFCATLNYVLHNAVRHGYVARWQDWPYCNAAEYLAEVGEKEAKRRWLKYPILDYGKNWDPPEL